MQLTPSERHALDAFSMRVRARFGDRIRSLKLFGSRARDDAHVDSDIDVCVVVADLDWREKREIYGIAGDILEELDIVLSIYAVSAEHMAHLRDRERAIAAEIERDGVAL